jgi:protein gp37
VADTPARLLDEHGAYLRSTPYPKGFAPTFHTYTLGYPEKCLTPARIFVSSMGDLFGEWVPDAWISEVFDACKRAPRHVYMFLTKNPRRYCDLANAGKLPAEPNFWYGTSVTGKGAPAFAEGVGYNTFLSIEPLLEDIDPDVGSFGGVRWLIVGAMTGPGSKYHQPKREWVEKIVEAAKITGAAVFMKDSLKPVWGDDLMRELPDGMKSMPEGPGPVPHCKECEHREETPQGRRGTAIACQIGWEAEGYDDRPARPVPGRYTRSSPPWCPRRKERNST